VHARFEQELLALVAETRLTDTPLEAPAQAQPVQATAPVPVELPEVWRVQRGGDTMSGRRTPS